MLLPVDVISENFFTLLAVRRVRPKNVLLGAKTMILDILSKGGKSGGEGASQGGEHATI